MPRRKYNKSYMRGQLPCYGCAYSNDDSGFPGRPGTDNLGIFSPCHMCMRSHRVQELIEHGDPLLYDQFPDGSQPVALPMDCYVSGDMQDQFAVWTTEAIEHATNHQIRQDVTKIAKEYGIDLGGHEVQI